MLESILNSAAQKQQHWSTHKHPAVRTTPGKKAVASSDTSRQLQWQQHKCNRKSTVSAMSFFYKMGLLSL